MRLTAPQPLPQALTLPQRQPLALPPLRWLYDYAWFAGFGVSAAVYAILMQGAAAADGADAPAWEGEG